MDVHENRLDFTVAYTAESGDDKLAGDFKISLNVAYPTTSKEI
jgi:hypothetical protein